MKPYSLVFAGGCFWGVQAYAKKINGVIETTCGYTNGITDNPSYMQVCKGETGYTEAVKILFDKEIISLHDLANELYSILEPKEQTLSQYRYGFFYELPDDEFDLNKFLETKKQSSSTSVEVECTPLHNFFEAEFYHQNYLDNNPDAFCHVDLRRFENSK